MGDRLELQTLLESFCPNVYFQLPTSSSIKYPCIVYERSSINTLFANNYPYKTKKRYTVTVIDRNPDSTIPDLISSLQLCTFDRHYTTDNLNHDVFTIFF